MEHITFYVQKRLAALVICYNPGLFRDKPLGCVTDLDPINLYGFPFATIRNGIIWCGLYFILVFVKMEHILNVFF